MTIHWTAFSRALRSRNYRLFFFGQGVSLIGTWMQQIAEVWLAYRLTGSPWSLGVMGFASQIPTFLLAPFAVAWIDRMDRHRIVIIGQVLSMVQALVLAGLTLSGHMTFPLLLVLSVLGGITDAFEIPARQSFVVQMVDRAEDLPNAIALNSSLVNLARLLGPSIAGLLIAWVGEAWCFAINGFSYLFVLIALVKIRPRAQARATSRSAMKGFLGGIRYVAGSTPIWTLLALLATVSLMTSASSILVPIFATERLGGTSGTLGFLMAASGLGALAAALTLANRSSVLGLGRFALQGMTLLGVGMLVFSTSRLFWLSWLAMLATGFGMMSTTASINTVLQTIVDDDKRGRVMSFFTAAFIGMAPLGNLAGGSMATHLTAPWTVRLAGLSILVAALILGLRLPALRREIRPIYARLGIIPEVATGLQASSRPISPGQ
jgi:MFS family permease